MKLETIAGALRLTPRGRKLLLTFAIALAVVYFALGVFIWRAMHKPPEAFASTMARMPGPVVFLAYPFETLWTRARAGTLNLGDRAPDFDLRKVDRSATVRLSSLNQRQPVVLVFGSYT